MRDASESLEKAGPEIYKTNPILGGGIKHFFSPAADFATRPMTSIDARRHWWGAAASTCAPVDNSCEAGELAHVGHRRAATSKKPESRRTQEHPKPVRDELFDRLFKQVLLPSESRKQFKAFSRWFTKSSRLGRRSKWGVG
jgi:hypothetical protein